VKGLLLRIGIDKGAGGCLAPIFRDGSFEYIPIPERCATSETRTYGHITGRSGKLLSSFVPRRLCHSVPHIDPEFETFTYGDPTLNKRRQLAKLAPGDLLVFYQGLEPEAGPDSPRIFATAYFAVKQVHDFNRIPRSEHPSILKRLSNNAHAKRLYPDDGLVIVEGDPQDSKLLPRAVILGDARDYVIQDIADSIGYSGSLRRAIGHWIEEERVGNIKKWLTIGPSILVTDDTRLFSYVLASDTGFAPNVTGGYCTLACCKPIVRRVARVGDWVVGTLPKYFGRNRLGYLMRVNETLTFDDLFNDDRFQKKKPSVDPHGDNIYYKKDGEFVQLQNNHHSEKDIEHDTKADRVLVGSLFWYFGGEAPEMPSKFYPLIKTGPSHKKITNTTLVKDLADWLHSKYRPGALGIARDRYDSGTAGVAGPPCVRMSSMPLGGTSYEVDEARD